MQSSRRAAVPRMVVLGLVLLGLASSGCSDLGKRVSLEFGWSPPLIPVRIGINTQGKVSVTFSGAIATPIGVFDVGVSGSTSIKRKIDALRGSDDLSSKRLLIVRVDGQATVYELEQGNRFDIDLDSGSGYRKVGFSQEEDGDMILEVESLPMRAERAAEPQVAPQSANSTSSRACPRPEACITFPRPDARLSGWVAFRGTAIRRGFSYYKFEYKAEANPDWNYLTSFESSVEDGVLMNWNTATVPSGPYILRLVVVDNTGNYWPEFAEIRVIVQN